MSLNSKPDENVSQQQFLDSESFDVLDENDIIQGLKSYSC